MKKSITKLALKKQAISKIKQSEIIGAIDPNKIKWPVSNGVAEPGDTFAD